MVPHLAGERTPEIVEVTRQLLILQTQNYTQMLPRPLNFYVSTRIHQFASYRGGDFLS